ncbi:MULTISPECIES: helix-turn-helix transcriptional regulator [Bosea]|uniref:ArsR/SmtB family transcription factor n=1 Tax=Bosea TaxID=85413 RepID=UPI00214F77A4|nr:MULTISPECIES: transcriptional regulator [Bosea]MCR4520250.1 transcriptional regulator [Bosea sp. 47.2.35]MDR6828724.1 DNA-binding transcriptional ArsR family regulator [Bosea robiniae]MDR6895383.1 DNA-binding transcriptional ArsR family regulator [Bosea sp. BE109]MDR7138779.1 DNA-binding transcriptional ArsR family regulator [Bosea sp. BE168]MDR7175246.1 DNA-binding transcriptional ArsR family regulator [Bosea sp. BE271]
MKPVFHPDIEDVAPADVFGALADPIRLGILVALSEVNEVDKARCSHFTAFASPSLLSYHFAKLREAGITRMRVEGTSRYLSIRREELNQRFPGLIDSVIETARRDPNLPRLGSEWLAGAEQAQGQTSSR